MNFWIVLKVALRNLRRTPLRTSLTTLGIVIGVAAVIAMVSIGSGARAQVEEQFAAFDTNRLTVTAQVPRSLWREGRLPSLRPGQGLTLEDYAAIRADVPGIAAASVEVRASAGEVNAHGRTSEANLQGIDADGFEIESREVMRGSAFGKADVKAAGTVCLITESLAEHLFDRKDPLGRLVRVQSTPFVVIGVVADDRRFAWRPGQQDTTVFIPYTSLLRRLDRNASISIALKADDPANLGRLRQAVITLLERRRGTRTAEFVAESFAEGIEAYIESRRTMTRLLGAIAGISLLVGGIGIMNIMLVSVTERTREIGLRMAIGTRGRDILRQFLIESMVLSVLGGALGIALGAGVARLLTRLNDWPTVITPESILVAFLCSAVIGIVFGYYPARQAARLDPIDALRFE